MGGLKYRSGGHTEGNSERLGEEGPQPGPQLLVNCRAV